MLVVARHDVVRVLVLRDDLVDRPSWRECSKPRKYVRQCALLAQLDLKLADTFLGQWLDCAHGHLPHNPSLHVKARL